ncbi:PLAC8-domain-containing protein, partial [Gyrodon lividus]
MPHEPDAIYSDGLSEPHARPGLLAGDDSTMPVNHIIPPSGSAGGVQQAQLQPTQDMVPGRGVQGGHSGKRGEREGETNGNQWAHGLFSCFGDCGTCIFSCFCPCMAFGKNRQRLDYLQDHGAADPEKGGYGLNEDCLWHCGFSCCGYWAWILQFPTRGNIRERRRIRGTVVRDCLTAYFCTPCELTQESRELEVEEQ